MFRIILRLGMIFLNRYVYARFGVRVGRIVSGSLLTIAGLLLLGGGLIEGSDGVVLSIVGAIILIWGIVTLVRGLRTPKGVPPRLSYDKAFPGGPGVATNAGYAYPPAQNRVSSQEPPAAY